MVNNRKIIGLGTGMLLLVSALTATGAQAASSMSICQVKKSGALSVKAKCSSSERKVKSIKQLVGKAGAAGAAGATGATGATGAAGATGPAGATGATGAAGSAVEKGDPGEQGIQGEKGDPGEQGIQGETGPEGPAGTVPEGVIDLTQPCDINGQAGTWILSGTPVPGQNTVYTLGCRMDIAEDEAPE